MKKSKFIEIIKKLIERERKLKEVSTSSATPGYMTPHAFSGKGKMDRRNSIASGSGYKKVNEAKFAVSIDLGLKGEPAQVIVDAGSKGAAITMVAKRLRGGRNDIKGVTKVNPGLGKKIDSVNEEITSAGYSEIGKRGRYLPLATKEFIKALKKQDDREVIKNIEYIADLMDFMKDTLKNKKYNESINEQSKVIKSISNLAKKNKYGTVTGTQMNGKTANMIMKIYNHPKMKKRQKDLDNLTSDELANLTIDRDVIRILGLNEGKYHDYRNDESLTPRQKIGHSMREIRNTLSELNKMIDMNVRLKNELNVDSRSYWKNTHKALSKISERLVKLANKVGKLQ